MKAIRWIGWTQGRGKCEADVQGNICSCRKESDDEKCKGLYRSLVTHLASLGLMLLTMTELKVPSSTTCVLTIPFASKAQNVAATKPACIAVSTVRAVEPCSMNEPVVRICRGRVRRYRIRNSRSSTRPEANGARQQFAVSQSDRKTKTEERSQEAHGPLPHLRCEAPTVFHFQRSHSSTKLIGVNSPSNSPFPLLGCLKDSR